MKGIILAGGKGTRLYPLTRKFNKHMLPLGNEPMLFNPIKQMLSAGIKDILIISSSVYIDDIRDVVCHGGFNGRFFFDVQQKAKGIAHALLLAEDFVGDDLAAVILGDNITTHSISPYAARFDAQGSGAKILLSKVADPRRYGIAVFRDDNLEYIVEKPKKNIGRYAVTGIYFYDSSVFDIIKEIAPSASGELEITPVNNTFLARHELTYDFLEGEWIDAGTMESYVRADALLTSINNELIFNERSEDNDPIS